MRASKRTKDPASSRRRTSWFPPSARTALVRRSPVSWPNQRPGGSPVSSLSARGKKAVGHGRQRGAVGLDSQHEADRVVARRRRPGRTRYGCDFPVCETLTHERPDVRRSRVRVRVEQDEERSRRAMQRVVVRLLEVAARRTGTKDGGVREKAGRENAGLRVIEDLDDDLVSGKRARHAGEPQPREVEPRGRREDRERGRHAPPLRDAGAGASSRVR